MGPDLYVDAEKTGGVARFMNHSCAPNCQAQMWTDDAGEGAIRIGMFTQKPVEVGEELTFLYNYWSRETIRCLCGAPCCKGTVNQAGRNHVASGHEYTDEFEFPMFSDDDGTRGDPRETVNKLPKRPLQVSEKEAARKKRRLSGKVSSEDGSLSDEVCNGLCHGLWYTIASTAPDDASSMLGL